MGKLLIDEASSSFPSAEHSRPEKDSTLLFMVVLLGAESVGLRNNTQTYCTYSIEQELSDSGPLVTEAPGGAGLGRFTVCIVHLRARSLFTFRYLSNEFSTMPCWVCLSSDREGTARLPGIGGESAEKRNGRPCGLLAPVDAVSN